MTINGAYFKGVGNIFKVFLENLKRKMEDCTSGQTPLHLVITNIKKKWEYLVG